VECRGTKADYQSAIIMLLQKKKKKKTTKQNPPTLPGIARRAQTVK